MIKIKISQRLVSIYGKHKTKAKKKKYIIIQIKESLKYIYFNSSNQEKIRIIRKKENGSDILKEIVPKDIIIIDVIIYKF